MNNKNNIPENEKNESVFLGNMEKKQVFSTPKDYFEVLPEVINNKKLENKSLNNYFDKLSYRIIGPVLAFSILLGIVFTWQNNTSEKALTNEQLSEYLLDEGYLEIEDYLVYESYYEAEIEETSLEESDDEYIDYLINNDIDINTIIEEL